MRTLSVPAALGALTLAFSANATPAPSLNDMALEAQQMARAAIRDLEAQPNNADTLKEWAKIDPTVLYGNHVSLIASNGTLANGVLARHSAVPNRLRSCDGQPENLPACLGNMKELTSFGIIRTDTGRLESLRAGLARKAPTL